MKRAAVPVVEFVISPSKAGHSIDASRARADRAFLVACPAYSFWIFSGRARVLACKDCARGMEACSVVGASCAAGGLDE